METLEQQQYVNNVEKLPTTVPQLPNTEWSPNHFFKQRNTHRGCLFWFSLIMSSLSLIFLFVLILLQTYLRAHINPNFEIISDTGIQIIAVAVFGQIFGVVYVIAHALWSNDEFLLMNTKK